MGKVRFAAIGLNHFHIWGQVEIMLRAGAEFVAFHAPEDDLARPFAEQHKGVPRVDDPRRILEDPTIQLVVSASIPAERAPLGIAAMRHGKDFMVDKPGVTSLAQLAEVRKVQRETGRIYSICYSEGPHRLDKERRPEWFFRREQTGGILTDIASHQCEQFLFFTGTLDAEIIAATVANRANPDTPELQDFGEMLLRTREATGYIRVDWFTPDGLPSWGDDRLVILGTDGYIELRKYVDVGGRPGIDHLIYVDRKRVHRIDCSDVELAYGRQLVQDVLERTETAMSQARCFQAMEIALRAQALAEAS